MRLCYLKSKIQRLTAVSLLAGMLIAPGAANASLLWNLNIGSDSTDLRGLLTLDLSVESSDFDNRMSPADFTYLFNGSVFGNAASFQGNQVNVTQASWLINPDTWALESFSFLTESTQIGTNLAADLFVQISVNDITVNSQCIDTASLLRCNGSPSALTPNAGLSASPVHNAVPEPATALLLGIGVFGLLATGRRKVLAKPS